MIRPRWSASKGREQKLNEKKQVDRATKQVPAPRTSSPAGHEEIERQVIESDHPSKNTPPKPKRPGASKNPLPKPNTNKDQK
jgi:hypothetical protein